MSRYGVVVMWALAWAQMSCASDPAPGPKTVELDVETINSAKWEYSLEEGWYLVVHERKTLSCGALNAVVGDATDKAVVVEVYNQDNTRVGTVLVVEASQWVGYFLGEDAAIKVTTQEVEIEPREPSRIRTQYENDQQSVSFFESACVANWETLTGAQTPQASFFEALAKMGVPQIEGKEKETIWNDILRTLQPDAIDEPTHAIMDVKGTPTHIYCYGDDAVCFVVSSDRGTHHVSRFEIFMKDKKKKKLEPNESLQLPQWSPELLAGLELKNHVDAHHPLKALFILSENKQDLIMIPLDGSGSGRRFRYPQYKASFKQKVSSVFSIPVGTHRKHANYVVVVNGEEQSTRWSFIDYESFETAIEKAADENGLVDLDAVGDAIHVTVTDPHGDNVQVRTVNIAEIDGRQSARYFVFAPELNGERVFRWETNNTTVKSGSIALNVVSGVEVPQDVDHLMGKFHSLHYKNPGDDDRHIIYGHGLVWPNNTSKTIEGWLFDSENGRPLKKLEPPLVEQDLWTQPKNANRVIFPTNGARWSHHKYNGEQYIIECEYESGQQTHAVTTTRQSPGMVCPDVNP